MGWRCARLAGPGGAALAAGGRVGAIASEPKQCRPPGPTVLRQSSTPALVNPLSNFSVCRLGPVLSVELKPGPQEKLSSPPHTIPGATRPRSDGPPASRRPPVSTSVYDSAYFNRSLPPDSRSSVAELSQDRRIGPVDGPSDRFSELPRSGDFSPAPTSGCSYTVLGTSYRIYRSLSDRRLERGSMLPFIYNRLVLSRR